MINPRSAAVEGFGRQIAHGMKACRFVLLAALLSLLPTVSGFGEGLGTSSSDVVTRLCRHIIQKRKKLLVDTNQAEIIWSDGAILEAGTSFPSALQELISRPTGHRDIRSFLKKVADENASGWKDASVTRSSRGYDYAAVRSLDGKVKAEVESVYVEYLGQRYPHAKIRMRDVYGPILFVVDGQIRASVMPLKLAN